jgi:hypothetical protein
MTRACRNKILSRLTNVVPSVYIYMNMDIFLNGRRIGRRASQKPNDIKSLLADAYVLQYLRFVSMILPHEES